jgi:DnaJ-class molecular chaperone
MTYDEGERKCYNCKGDGHIELDHLDETVECPECKGFGTFINFVSFWNPGPNCGE